MGAAIKSRESSSSPSGDTIAIVRSFRVAVVASCVTLAFALACNALTGVSSLEPTLEDGAEGGASSSGGSSGASSGSTGDDGAVDAPTDSQPFDAGKIIQAIDLVDVGTAGNATGFSGQQHLVWAPVASRWVLFYVTSAAPTELRSKISSDFVTWIDGVTLTMPHPNVDGRNIAVARATLGGKDVFHVGLSFRLASADHRAYAARAVLTNETFAWNTPVEVTRSTASDDSLDIDGQAIGITNDGYVTLFTGLRTNNADGSGGTGNEYAMRSSVPDDGIAAFTPTWNNTTIEIVPTICNARAGFPLGNDDFLAFYENGSSQPVPNNIRWTRANGTGVWSSELSVFPNNSNMDIADWAVFKMTDTDVHVVRRAMSGGLNHQRYDGVAMQNGSGLADDVLENGAGITLLPLGAPSIMLAGVAASESIRSTTWNGSTWSAWSTLLAAPAAGTRRFLSSGGASAGPSAVVWTEDRGSTHVIAGARIR